MAAYPVNTIIDIAKICQYLATVDIQSRKFATNQAIDKRLPTLIYLTRKDVEWMYGWNPAEPTLVGTANRLLSLCFPYVNKALQIMNGGGSGTIVNPTTGTESAVVGYYTEFTVGQVGAPILDGQSSFVIALPGFVENSIAGDIGGAELPMFRNDQYSFTVNYSNPAQVTINFNAPVSNGMFFQFRGLRLQPVVTPSANTSETFIIVDTYADYVLQSTGPYFKRFLVLADEVHGGGRTIQEYWPNTSLQWNAAVETEDLTI